MTMTLLRVLVMMMLVMNLNGIDIDENEDDEDSENNEEVEDEGIVSLFLACPSYRSPYLSIIVPILLPSDSLLICTLFVHAPQTFAICRIRICTQRANPNASSQNNQKTLDEHEK